MTTPLRLSVVIPTYQRRESLLRTLASLATQTLPADEYEVIAAVDGSTDGTAEAARRFAVPYSLAVIEGPNRGRAGACNAGIRAAAGDVVVLLDDDMEAAPGFLAAHARAHEGPAPRAVVGAAPIVVRPDSPPFVRYMAKGFAARLERLGKPGYRLHFRDTYTGNFSVRRSVLLQVGGFDDAFRVYGHEDYELALRLQAAGVELAYSLEACAHQHYEKNFAGFARDGIARGRTAVLFAAKHPGQLDRLKLSEYDRETRVWRAVRSLLLDLSRFTDHVPGWIIALINRMEPREPRKLERYYTMAIDYLYWYGVFTAQREQGAGSSGASLPASVHSVSRRVGIAPAGARTPRPAARSWAGTRARIALLLVLLYAGASTIGWLQRAAASPKRSRQDEISAYDLRFKELRSALPARGVVGYVGSPDPTGPTPSEANAAALLHFRRYLLAQYALAPLLVIESTEPEFVVGNFEPGALPPTLPGLRLVQDFGNGIVLFRRAGP